MIPLTEEEFDRIIVELLETKPVKYDALCAAAEKLLTKPLRRKCAEVPALGSVCTYEDLLSETYIRLIKCAIPSFFLRTETVNRDREGFCRWVYTVAANICRDKIRFSVSHAAVPLENDDDEDSIPLQIADPSAEKPFAASEDIETLRSAFAIVLGSDMQIYKVITWVAQAVMILSEGVSKIESNDLLIRRYESMTLDRMWEEIRRASAALPWLRVGKEDDLRVRKMLDAPFKENVRYGDMRYSDFYMKKGAKASNSDWVNRINAVIRRNDAWNM